MKKPLCAPHRRKATGMIRIELLVCDKEMCLVRAMVAAVRDLAKRRNRRQALTKPKKRA